MTNQSFIIKGLAGAKTLSGSVSVNGAKNAALKAMAAALLFDAPVTLENIPDTADVHTLSTILNKLGVQVKLNGKSKEHPGHSLLIDPSNITSTNIDQDLAGGMRASVVLTGPLLARCGSTTFPAPGGCVLGARPIDLFIEGYKKMSATVVTETDLYRITSTKSLRGTEIFFDFQTVGGTETLMMAAVLAEGTTILKNCALEPEIVNVAEWLVANGASIQGAGTSTITIVGTNGKLLSPKVPYVAIPDRLEAGSFLILGALCARDLTITDCNPAHLESVISLLRNSGVTIETTATSIRVTNTADKPNSAFKSFNVRTHEYPGFPTDLQAPIVTYLTQVSGESTVLETIFASRFKYVEDLQKMGAQITVMNPREILIKGPTPLKQLSDDEELRAHDIRAGFAVVIAALCGTGTFTVNNVHLIDRGYEKLEERLTQLGAKITRMRG